MSDSKEPAIDIFEAMTSFEKTRLLRELEPYAKAWLDFTHNGTESQVYGAACNALRENTKDSLVSLCLGLLNDKLLKENFKKQLDEIDEIIGYNPLSSRAQKVKALKDKAYGIKGPKPKNSLSGNVATSVPVAQSKKEKNDE